VLPPDAAWVTEAITSAIASSYEISYICYGKGQLGTHYVTEEDSGVIPNVM